MASYAYQPMLTHLVCHHTLTYQSPPLTLTLYNVVSLSANPSQESKKAAKLRAALVLELALVRLLATDDRCAPSAQVTSDCYEVRRALQSAIGRGARQRMMQGLALEVMGVGVTAFRSYMTGTTDAEAGSTVHVQACHLLEALRIHDEE